MCCNCKHEPCVHFERQRTFGDVVGMPPIVSVEPDPVTCPECGVEGRFALTEDCNGVEVCDDCWGESSFRCEECGETGCIDDIYSDDSAGEVLCQSCYDERYAICPCCNESVAIDGGDTEVRDGSHYHHDCFWDTFSTCDDCGEVFCQDDLSYDERRDESYCPGCNRGSGRCIGKRFQHKPDDTFALTGSLRTFGIELETSNCDDFDDLDGETYFTAKEDGSIDGKEFVSGILRGDRGLDAVQEFCHGAERLGFDVDSACGYHLHIGVRDLTEQQRLAVMLAYRYCQDAWFTMVDGDRAGNSYCCPLRFHPNVHIGPRSWGSVMDAAGSRYRWVNVEAFTEHGTIEVRLHGGTLSHNDVNGWVRGHLRFVEHFAKMPPAAVHARFGGKAAPMGEQFNAMCEAWNDDGLAKHFVNKARWASGVVHFIPVLDETV